MKFQAPNYKLVEPGMYEAMIERIEEKVAPDGRAYAVWTFKITDTEGDDVVVKRPTSLNFGPRSIARRFAEVALGRPIRAGEVIETADLVGKRLKIVVTREPGADGTERNVIGDTPLPA